MADILSLVFRTYMHKKSLNKDAGSAGVLPVYGSTLLVGEQSISISRSVLMLAAVTAASQMGMRVLFFTHTQIQSLPPSLQRCVPNLSPDSLKKIQFSYPRTVEELLQQVASLHESTNTSLAPPSLIIVDRLECFLRSHSSFPQGEQSCAAHVCALLSDTAAFLSQKLESQGFSSGPCRIIASFLPEVHAEKAEGGSSATDPILDVLDRYFEVRCTLDPDRGYGATAAGAAELWSIYLSGRGRAEDSVGVSVTQEWRLFVFPDALMEFTLV